MATEITEICVHCDEMNSVCECYTDDMTLYECIKCDKQNRSTEMMFNKNGLNPFCSDCYDGEYEECKLCNKYECECETEFSCNICNTDVITNIVNHEFKCDECREKDDDDDDDDDEYPAPAGSWSPHR